MDKPGCLDLFCGAGGATRGLQRAGFHVTGLDIKAQPRYCGDAFVQGDALSPPFDLRGFDFIWASPPCQAYSVATNTQDKSQYPRLIPEVRAMLRETGKPYAIENVEGAPLELAFVLCGAMFGLRTYRHRIFESNVFMLPPGHPQHRHAVAKMGRPAGDAEFLSPVGNFSGVSLARQILDLPAANRDELSQAIPPAYSEFIGRQIIGDLITVPRAASEMPAARPASPR